MFAEICKTSAWSVRRLTIALALLSLGSLPVAKTAGATTLTFDEIPFQSIDGLSHAGVTFDYKLAGIDSSEAFYNSFGPGALAYVDDPSLTGDSAGVLTLDFSVPTAVLEFGLALNTANQLTPGFRVELFSPNSTSLGETSVPVIPNAGVFGFSENRYTYSGGPISRAIVRFNHQPGSFAFDNLTFFPIPEPSTFVMGTVIFIAVVSYVRCGRRNTTMLAAPNGRRGQPEPGKTQHRPE